jgi:quercetin dioxygenase-like cupin family protein
MKIATLLGCAVLLTVSGSGQMRPDVHQEIIPPDSLKWVDNPAWPGRRTATLFGNQQSPGPYVVRVRFPPNNLNPPHSHPDNRLVTVLSGTWYLGHGEKPDRSETTQVTPGTFFIEPAGNVHFEFTGADEVIVQVVGTGPTGTNYLK